MLRGQYCTVLYTAQYAQYVCIGSGDYAIEDLAGQLSRLKGSLGRGRDHSTVRRTVS